MITPCSFSICDITNWVLDTRSLIHICNSLQGLRISRRFKEGERFLNMGDGSRVPVLALGVVELFFESRKILLSECHFCPSFLLNVISVGQLAIEGYDFSIKKDILNIIVNDLSMMCGQLSSKIYILSWSVNVLCTPSKRPRLDNVDDSYLWHCRLGHINKNRISRLVKEGILNDIGCESIKTYESYLLGKMIKSPFIEKGKRAKEILGLIHIDVCGPMNIAAMEGFSYFIIFTDDHSKFSYVFLMRHKSESFKIFKRYRN